MTLVGVEPATFRFVAQYLNHCATADPGRPSGLRFYDNEPVESGNQYLSNKNNATI